MKEKSLLIPDNVARYLEHEDGRKLFRLVVETWGMIKPRKRKKEVTRQAIYKKMQSFLSGGLPKDHREILLHYLEPSADRYFMYYDTVPKDSYEVDTIPF